VHVRVYPKRQKTGHGLELYNLGTPRRLLTAHTQQAPGAALVVAHCCQSSAQFQILYFAEDHQTALFEFGAMVGSPHIPGRAIPNPGVPALVLNVQITLQQVFDLTQARSAQVPLQTTAQELTGDWDGYQSRSPMTSVTAPIGLAETQTLGEALFQTGIEGFRSLSAKIPYARTLMVFPTNLRRGSSIVYIDSGTVVHRIDGTI
jgi:RES domain